MPRFFAGLSSGEDRANLIAFLNKNGPNLPLPTAPAADVAAGGEGAQAPGAGEKGSPAEAGAAAQPVGVTEGVSGAAGGTKSNEGVETTTGPS
jgi:hypothetical protein